MSRKYEAWYPLVGGKLGKGLPSWHKGKVDYDTWRNASYGISRLEGMLKFMESEDWTQRLPEMQEFLKLCDKQRGIHLQKLFLK